MPNIWENIARTLTEKPIKDLSFLGIPTKTKKKKYFEPNVKEVAPIQVSNPIERILNSSDQFDAQRFNVINQAKAFPEFLMNKFKAPEKPIEEPRPFKYEPTPPPPEEEVIAPLRLTSESPLTHVQNPLNGEIFRPDSPQQLDLLQEASVKAKINIPIEPDLNNYENRKKFDEAKQGLRPPSKTPPLYTEGNKIKRSDTGQDVILKGVTNENFRNDNQHLPIEEMKTRLKWVSDWGGNLVTLYADPRMLKTYIKEVDEVVTFAQNNGLYINFAPIPRLSENVQARGFIKDWLSQIGNSLPFLAKRYKDKSNVIYNLGAEPPGDFKWDEWINVVTPIAKAIRNENPNSLLLVPGVNLGRKVEPFTKELPFKNIVYAPFDYFWNTAQNLPVFGVDPNEHIEAKFRDAPWADPKLSQYPLLVPEFGAYWGGDFGGDTDMQVIHRVLKDIQKRGLSFTMHSLDTHPFPNRGLGLIDEFGRLTRKGQEIKNHLYSYPATFNE